MLDYAQFLYPQEEINPSFSTFGQCRKLHRSRHTVHYNISVGQKQILMAFDAALIKS